MATETGDLLHVVESTNVSNSPASQRAERDKLGLVN